WLYDVFEVVVHPERLVTSMGRFTDGSPMAQVSPPDMRLPIAYALGAGRRLSSGARPVDWTTAATWTFEPVDREAFPALDLAIAAGRRGGTHPAVYNAANEVLVDAFHDRHIPFTGISDWIDAALAAHAYRVSTGSCLSASGVLSSYTTTQCMSVVYLASDA